MYLLILCFISLFSQVEEKEYAADLSQQINGTLRLQYQRMEPYFKEAYALYPSVPRGMLEAVSFTYTRFTHLVPLEESLEEETVPCIYGLMGLTLDGRGFFRDNLHFVSELSGFPVEDIAASPRDNVVAYAAAYAVLQRQYKVCSSHFEAQIPILVALSELPLSNDSVLAFALHSSLYAVAQFLDDDFLRNMTGVLVEKPDFERCFGRMLPLLRARTVSFSAIEGGYVRGETPDYGLAIWNPAGSCNYTVGRGGHQASAIAIHYTQGTYAGSIAWFQNCTYNGVGARASAHYVVRSFDGQVTQMVREADKAWHVGNGNPYTIGIEHEAYGDISSFFTPEMYRSSADLVRDICDRNGISPHRMFYRDTLDDGTALNSGLHSLGGESACVKIRGHQHFPDQSHTDPGPYWNWNYYYKLVNEGTPVTRFDTPSGILTDSGGPDGDYGNDERQLLLIHVDGAESITLSFSEFDLENDYDFLWIYDGATVFSPLIGRWNTISPGTVTSSGSSLLVEFRSDCATTASGWEATWQAEVPVLNLQPATEVLWDENQWVTEDLSLAFADSDDSAIAYRFYQVTGSNGQQWTADPNCGFAYDDFDGLDFRLWSVGGGSWHSDNGQLRQVTSDAAEIELSLRTDPSEVYLYELDLSLPNGDRNGQMAGVRFGSSSNVMSTDAYELAVLPQESRIEISYCHQGAQTVLCAWDGEATCPDIPYHYQIIHDEPSQKIIVLRNGRLLGECPTFSSTTAPSYGMGMSFVTQGTAASFDNLRVFRSRTPSVTLTVGNGETCTISWQASNGNPMAKVRSVVVDDESAFSAVAEKFVRVDYSSPSLNGLVAFGLNGNAGFVPAHNSSFRWQSASDSQSGVAYYEYGVTLDPGLGSTAITWLGTTEYNHLVFRPSVRLTENLFFAVRAVNGAGLHSDPIFSEYRSQSSRVNLSMRSNGTDEVLEECNTSRGHLQLWPNPTAGGLNVELPSSSVLLSIFDACGRRVYEREVSEREVTGKSVLELNVAAFKRGLYYVQSVRPDGTVLFGTFLKE